MLNRSFINNPLLVFVLPWVVVFFLYSLSLSVLLPPLSEDFVSHMFGILAFTSLCYMLAQFAPVQTANRCTVDYFQRQVAHVYVLVIWLFKIGLLIFGITMVAFAGAPLLWLMQGVDRSYTEFGFSTLHGFFNSLVLLLGTLTFWLISTKKTFPAAKYILAFCLAVPILSLHRQSLVSLLLQCMFTYAAIRPGRNWQAVKGTLILVLFAGGMFSILGDIRTGDEVLLSQASIVDGLTVPTPLLWIYMYLTTTVGNFYDLTEMIFPHTYGATSLSGLTPTVIREAIWGGHSAIHQYFIDRTFNSSTYALVIYLDFDWIGVYLFTGCVIAWATVLYRRYSASPNLYFMLNLVILNHIIFLFVFANFLLTWGVIFEFVLVRILKSRLSRIDARV